MNKKKVKLEFFSNKKFDFHNDYSERSLYIKQKNKIVS